MAGVGDNVANIDKTSVREELDRLKADFQRQSDDGVVSRESHLLIKSLFALLDLIVAIFLERQTAKTSRNSGKPSSQTEKDETSLSQTGSKKKNRVETDESAFNSRTRETVTLSEVTACSTCGEDLSGTPVDGIERRTRLDIVFEKVVEHVDAEIKTCRICKKETKGSFPSGMPGHLQYGNGLRAFSVNLLVGQMVSLNRVQKTIRAMVGQLLSEATLLKFVLRLHKALAEWERSAISTLIDSRAMHVDETSLRVDRKNHWIHVYSSGDITLKRLHRKRGGEAIRAINIIPRYGGVIVHDCWASYLTYDQCGHGLCGSHLLRELTFVIESNNYRWAFLMKRLLQETCRAVAESEGKCLDEPAYKRLQRRYRNILTRGEKELPAIPKKPSGRRGKMARSDAHNLWERMKVHESAVLLFAKNSHVAFTNNRAERDLRMSKVKQKVSGCFRTVTYAEAYCRISSYLQTMANRGVNPLIAIQMVLAGKALE